MCWFGFLLCHFVSCLIHFFLATVVNSRISHNVSLAFFRARRVQLWERCPFNFHLLLLNGSGCTLIYSNCFSGFYSSETGCAMKNVVLSKASRSSCLWSPGYVEKTNSIPSLPWPLAARQQRHRPCFPKALLRSP